MGVKLQVATSEYRYFAWGDKLVSPGSLRRAPGSFLVAPPAAFGTPSLTPGTDLKEGIILWP
jgi:hypothetical protein